VEVPIITPTRSRVSPSRKRTFQIHVGSGVDTVVGRREAVRHAKHVSRQTGRPIVVEAADGRVTMEFRRGRLESYKVETRGADGGRGARGS
jgi:hypothetical protein